MKDVKIEYGIKSGFSSAPAEGICHVKTLPFLSVVQATEGNYDIQLGDGKTYNTGEGGFFIAPSNVLQTITHHVNKHSGLMSCRWVFLSIKIDDAYYFDQLYDSPVILPASHTDTMNHIFNQLFSATDIFDEHIAYYQIAKTVFSVSSEKETQFPSCIMDVLDFINSHYHTKISITQLAQQINMSESYFYTLFKKAVGISPIAYINNLRLSIASDLLINTHQSITAIASAVGIQDSIYFNKLFRQRYQMPPSAYRNTYKSI